jgi:MFS family permease
MSEEVTEHELDHAAPSVLTDAERRRGMVFVCLMVGAAGFGLALQLGMNDNFLAEEIGIQGFEKGVSEAVRESCGIIAFAVLALMAGFTEPIVAMLVLLLGAIGLGSYAVAPDFGWVLGMSLVWSLGLHVWFPLPNAMALSLAEPGRAGRRMGQRRAAEAVGMMLGFLVALGLARTFAWLDLPQPMRPLFLVAGVAMVLGAAACLGIPRRLRTPGPRFVFRRKYGLYYLLSFLEGWRKQIFLGFAGFLLVTQLEMKLWMMLVLWSTVQGIGFISSPLVGRLIDRVGERRVLMAYYATMTVFFIGYATIRVVWVLCVIFVLDNAMFVMVMALTTYAGRIAPPSERTATLSVGVASNHVAAVAMPLVGGLMWKHLGYQWPFIIGAAGAVLSIAVASRIPRRTRSPAGRG